MTLATPGTFFVGAGPVATALAGALRLGGVPVLGLWGRTAERARAAGSVAGVAAYSSAPPDVMLEADAVVVAVKDDAIGDVADMLVATGLITTRHTLVHCSGALAAEDAFERVRDRIGGVGTMHPLRAVSDARAVMRDLAGTVFGVQGDARGQEIVRALVEAVGGTPIGLEGAQMAAYHAAAAIASNYLVALMDAASELLVGAGVPRRDGLAALLPLVEGTVANLRDKGLPTALTGPIRRGDRATVARHLAALPASIAPLYRQLGLRTVEIARMCGDASDEDLAEIEAMLEVASEAPPQQAVRR